MTPLTTITEVNCNRLLLADWRRTVAELYSEIRHKAQTDPQAAWEHFRHRRDSLYKHHPQTALSPLQLSTFEQLPFFDYDPELRLIGHIDTAVEPETFEVELPADGNLRYTRVAKVHFMVKNMAAALNLYWIEGYGGGIFLPFADQTSGQSTYGGGRYLYDAIKGADLGVSDQEIILDFNFAYNPSCSYNHLWVCPLAPAENRLPFAVPAGEIVFE